MLLRQKSYIENEKVHNEYVKLNPFVATKSLLICTKYVNIYF